MQAGRRHNLALKQTQQRQQVITVCRGRKENHAKDYKEIREREGDILKGKNERDDENF